MASQLGLKVEAHQVLGYGIDDAGDAVSALTPYIKKTIVNNVGL